MAKINETLRAATIRIAKDAGLEVERLIAIVELMDEHCKGLTNGEIIKKYADIPIPDEWTIALLVGYLRDKNEKDHGVKGEDLFTMAAADAFAIGSVVGYHLAKKRLVM